MRLARFGLCRKLTQPGNAVVFCLPEKHRKKEEAAAAALFPGKCRFQSALSLPAVPVG
jgi:hypothetical protein